MRKLWLFAAVLFAADVTFGQTLTVRSLRLPVGTQKTLEVVPPQDPASLRLSFDESIVAVDAATLLVTGLKVGETDVTVTKNGTDFTATSKITVVPVTLRSTAITTPLVEGEQRTIDVTVSEGDTSLPLDGINISSDDIDVITVSGKTLRAGTEIRGSATANLNVTRGNVALGKLAVTVREAISGLAAPDTLEVEEGKSKDLGIRLVGTHGTIFTPAERSIRPLTTTEFLDISPQGTVQARELATIPSGPIRVSFDSPEGLGRTSTPIESISVSVRGRASRLTFTPNFVILPRRGIVHVTAKLITRNGQDVPIFQTSWALKNPDDAKWVKLAPSENNQVDVIWNDAGTAAESTRPSIVEIVATAKQSATATDATSDTLIVRFPGDVADFAPLRVKLNVMDNQTAADLYGERAARDYYVTRVRLNNNLDIRDKPQLAGASILAFSDSIEIAVVYEKRKIGTNGKPEGDWSSLAADDLKAFEPAGGIATVSSRAAEPTCQGFLTYRPYMFEMMVNSVDRRDDRSRRGRTFRALNGIGTAVSFITAVAVPGAGSDVPLALEKFSNLLVPGLEKLWPNLKETQRQNLVSQTMRTIEEIPFGSDLSRVLFFPKGAFRGLVTDHETRVAQICPFYFNIEVAVITKENRESLNAAARP